jgi:translation initiation factor IF-3
MNQPNRPSQFSNRTRINNDIRVKQVRVIMPDGSSDIKETYEAQRIANDLGLDLVEIQPNAQPPVCRIVDYGKYQYEQQKKDKQTKKNTRTAILKEVRFHPNTDTHDFNFKAKHAEEFLTKGDKVKATVTFLGRSIVYKDKGFEMMQRLSERLSNISKIESPPKMEGRNLIMFLVPDKDKITAIQRAAEKEKKAQEKREAKAALPKPEPQPESKAESI